MLAWALSVDLWSPEWTAERQRAAIADAYAQHRLKGTPAGWKLVLDRIGAVYDIVERVNGAAFTASIDVLNIGDITLPSEAAMQRLLQRTKRASVHLTITASSGVGVPISMALGAGGAALPRHARLALVIDETAT